jgi:hypothetical protein
MLKVSARRATRPGAFREDVAAKIDQYSIAGAVSGTLRAIGQTIGRSRDIEAAIDSSVTTRHNGAAHSETHQS